MPPNGCKTEVLVPRDAQYLSTGDSGSSNIKRSLEYQNSCGTRKDLSTDTITEVTVATANGANDDERASSFLDVRCRYLLCTDGTTYTGISG